MAVTDRAPAPACAHCGLDIPAALRGVASPLFCCGGCHAAYDLIRAAGLDRYYDLPERRGAAVMPARRGFEEFDHRVFHDLYVRRTGDGLAETELLLDGVHCASCVWLVERTPRLAPGLVRAELDVRRGLVRLAWDPSATSLSRVARALDRLGYRPVPHRAVGDDRMRRREDRAAIAGIGVAGAIAANVMLLALALYSGQLDGMERHFERYFRWLSLALTTPSLFGPGRVFFQRAIAALRTRTLHMDVPIALALAAGWMRGAWNTLVDAGPIYFDGVAALVFLLLVGRHLQHRAQRAAGDAATLLEALSPPVARLIEGDRVRETPVEALLPGMEVEVRPGDTVPADGRVVEGYSTMDLSLLTGESRAVPVQPDTTVFAGTLNGGGVLRVRIEHAGEATRLGRILRSVEEGARRRAPIVRLADRLAARFVGAVLALAAITFTLWYASGTSQALDRAIALLVVTCPCALALATPLTITSAIGKAARHGILVKSGDALERLARPAVIVLDKTGTVTEGRTALEWWAGPAEVRAMILAVERHATHPVAEGFRAAWPEVTPASASDVTVTVGGGVEGTAAGRRVVVGSPRFVRARASGAPAPCIASERLTPVDVAIDGRWVGRAAFADPIRPEAGRVLAALRARGWRVRLLSGDDPAVTRAVGELLGCAPADCRGGATPEDKLAAIVEWSRQGPVVVVGDGVNDAAAIARAAVGVGVRGGAEACLSAADVCLTRPGLEPLAMLVAGAERTLRVIRRGIACSLVYNVVGAALAVAGIIDPLIAAFLMPASSITVVVAAWGSRTFSAANLRTGRPRRATLGRSPSVATAP